MRQAFQIYHEDIDALESLTDEQMGRLVRLICSYSKGEDVKPDKDLLIAFAFISQKIRRDAEKYEERCEKNRQSINKRWNKDENKPIPTNTNEYKRIQLIPTVTVTETATVTNKALDYSQRKDSMDGVIMEL